MKPSPFFLPICCLCLVMRFAGETARVSGEDAIRPESFSAAVVQTPDKLVYADFETVKDNRVVSNRGGIIQLFGYQERPTMPSRFKGVEGSNPPAPEIVHLKKDDPNKAIAFDFQLQSSNQYAGVGVEIHAQADQDGKSVGLDVSSYKYLVLQLYATGVQTIRIEFTTRGQGLTTPDAPPQSSFTVKPGFNTYQIPLKSLSQPVWATVKLSPKDVLKKLTSINVVAYCEACTPMSGTVVMDNLVFQN